jgi:hypothetical protein
LTNCEYLYGVAAVAAYSLQTSINDKGSACILECMRSSCPASALYLSDRVGSVCGVDLRSSATKSSALLSRSSSSLVSAEPSKAAIYLCAVPREILRRSASWVLLKSVEAHRTINLRTLSADIRCWDTLQPKRHYVGIL